MSYRVKLQALSGLVAQHYSPQAFWSWDSTTGKTCLDALHAVCSFLQPGHPDCYSSDCLIYDGAGLATQAQLLEL